MILLENVGIVLVTAFITVMVLNWIVTFAEYRERKHWRDGDGK